MKNKGIESLKDAVLKDTRQYNNCFNENGCDHEFHRIVPETNQNLIEMGCITKCISVSKCSHKYCDKYKWVIERAKHYANKTGKSFEEIIEIWEKNRTYWYMNYYQDNKQPLIPTYNYYDEKIAKTKERIEFLKQEIETWEFLSTTLDKEHQQTTKNDILIKVDIMKTELDSCVSKIQMYEINCFDS